MAERLASVIHATASGDGSVPPDLLGRLLTHVSNIQASVLSPRGMTLAGLSDREVEVLRLVAGGLSNRQIAATLVISPRTAEHHVQHVYTKIGVSTRAAAAMFAMQHGLLR